MNKFKKIYIEITNRCNLMCGFCHRSNRPGAFLRVAEFEKILEQIKSYTDYIALHVLGEPLLHPDIAHLLESCSSHGLQVNLSTNGTLISKHRATLLGRPALRQINFSLHGVAFSETGPALETYLSEVLDFVREATASTPMFISLRLWNLETITSGEASTRTRLILRRIESFFGLPGRIPEKPTPGNGIPLASRVFLSQEHPFTWPHAAGSELGDRGTCRGLRDHIAILVDGTVVPCCLDAEADIPLGNIHHQPLAEILSGSRANVLRQGFANQHLVDPLCRRCTYRQRFESPRKNG